MTSHCSAGDCVQVGFGVVLVHRQRY
jgi:hypothetical protein